MLIKIITNRGVIFLLGLVAFAATCATFSPSSVSIPQFCGFFIYSLMALLLFRMRTDLLRMIIFTLPFAIWIFVALTNNSGLFPDVVPLLMITCLVGFYAGASLIPILSSSNKARVIIPIALSAVYLLIVVELIVPRIIFWRQHEPLPSMEFVAGKQLNFLDRSGETFTINPQAISVIDFWFTKCGVCYPNNDYLNEQAQKYKKLGVNFYLVYMGNIDTYEDFQKSQKKGKWKSLKYLYDPQGRVSKMFNLAGAPHTLIVSGEKVLYHQSSFSEETSEMEAKEINEIIMAEVGKNTDLKTIVSGIKNKIDLGVIKEQDSLHIFRLKNTSANPLYIQDIKASCNCVISSWTKEAITTNEYGEISFSLEGDESSVGSQTLVIATSSIQSPYTIVDLAYSKGDRSIKQ